MPVTASGSCGGVLSHKRFQRALCVLTGIAWASQPLRPQVSSSGIVAAPSASFDFSNAGQTIPARKLASDPGTCTVGEQYFNTTANVLKACTAANTWTQSTAPAYSDMGSVLACGAKGDGSTDDTAAINACTAAYLNVYFPQPTVCYKITNAIQLRSEQTITGSSRTANKGICSYSTTADALFASFGTNGTRDIIIQNLYIKDAVRATRTAGHGIHIDGSTDAATVTIRDTMIYGFQDGINTTSLMKSIFDNNRQTSSLRDAWHNQLTSTSTHVTNNYADAPGRYGYYADFLNYSEFTATACDNAISDCYHFEAGDGGVPRNITFNSPGVESGNGHGIYLDGTGFVLNNPSITGIPTGTGKAGIYLNGAAQTTIINPRITGADWAINLAAVPLHVSHTYDGSNVVFNLYATGQGIAQYNDPNGLLSIGPTRILYNVTAPVTDNNNVTTDQLLMAIPTTTGILNTAGKTFRVTGSGVYTTGAGQTPTLTFKIKLCRQNDCGGGTATTIASWTTAAATASSTNFPWRVTADVTTATTGSAGTVECHGVSQVSLGATITTAEVRNDQNSGVSPAQDLSQALWVAFTVATSSASSTNSITQRLGKLEMMN